MVEFDKSIRFMRFVPFLEKQGVIKLNRSIPEITQPDVLDEIGLGFFVHYLARGMSPARRVTFVPLDTAHTAVLVEPLPRDDGVFLRGPQDGDYAPIPIPSTMHAIKGLCPARALIHANWATYMETELPDLPGCTGCAADGTCATAKWILSRLSAQPDDALGLVGGHALVLNAAPAVFEVVGTEPVVDEPDPAANLAGAKRLDMKYFDAYLTLDLGAQAGAKVYIPNTQLSKPVVSPYECDVVVYDKDKDYLAIVENAIGTGPDDDAIQEERVEKGVAAVKIPSIALRLRRKHASHAGLSALGVKNYRYVYATVGKIDFGENEKSHGGYTRHLMAADPPMTVIELENLVPEALGLRAPKWWKPQVLRDAFMAFRGEIRKCAAP